LKSPLRNFPKDWLFPESLEVAGQVQRAMAHRVIPEDVEDCLSLDRVRYVGGVDVSNTLRDPENQIYAALVVLDYPSLSVCETSTIQGQARFPYVPGFLGFREAPVLVEAFEKLFQNSGICPDLVLVDGQGISHPRGLGIASHLGVLLDIPTIGVAKSILVGHPEGVPENRPGAHVPLVWKGKTVGAVVRTKANTQPVYVSIGHKISLPTAIDWVLRCGKGYRLPEPTRQAHQAANAFRKERQFQNTGF
jgi:deoxyribonuclease V